MFRHPTFSSFILSAFYLFFPFFNLFRMYLVVVSAAAVVATAAVVVVIVVVFFSVLCMGVRESTGSLLSTWHPVLASFKSKLS